jgi:hypothetical protein
MESGLMMLLHSAVIVIVLFLIMFFALRQKYDVAMDRSLLIGSFALMYMLLFGHGLPVKINKTITG